MYHQNRTPKCMMTSHYTNLMSRSPLLSLPFPEAERGHQGPAVQPADERPAAQLALLLQALCRPLAGKPGKSIKKPKP